MSVIFWKLSVPIFLFALMLCLLPSGTARADSGLKLESAYSTAALIPGKPVSVTVVVSIEAPIVTAAKIREPLAISMVVDRSGSMGEAKKLDYAKLAGKALVKSLEAGDNLGVVIYDDTVQELVALGPVRDKDAIYRKLDALEPGGYTFLSGGLEEGIKQVRNSKLEGPRRVLLLSDGLANQGVTDGEAVAAIGAAARKNGVTVSTIGLGVDYDENLMRLLAQRGGGRYYYVKDSEDLPSVFKQELALTADMYTRGLKTVFQPSPIDSNIVIYGYATSEEGSARLIDMSDLSSGEKRRIVLNFTVLPHYATASVQQDLGSLYFSYEDAIEKKSRKIELPLSLNIVRNEAELAEENAKMADSIRAVLDEGLLQEAEVAHVAAMEALDQGRVDIAERILDVSKKKLAAAAPGNKILTSKMEAMEYDRANLSAAASDPIMQKTMDKRAKSSAYQSAQGVTQGFMLQKGDRGFMVEKLQKALAAKGFFHGEINGVFDLAVEEAVKAFQKSAALEADGVAGQATQLALGM